mmetsp:Transcript_38755/g.112029  ORF Transcript_38755/g.112029 Transcript_38755/m.112029 type:complete len:510 (+) Transcript_38755:80-1609(+)
MSAKPGEYVTSAIEEYVGIGKFQYRYVTALCFTYGLVVIHTYSNMFASGDVAWHGSCPGSTDSLPCVEVELHAPDNCSVPLELWHTGAPGASIVGDFQLVCSRHGLLPQLGSIYFAGYACGVVLCGNISDRLGRRWAYILGYALILLGGFLAPLAPSWPVYAAARAFLGAGVAGCGLVSFVWATEFLDTKTRQVMCWLPNIAFSLGQSLASPMAYYFPHWRHSLLACQLVSLIGLTYYCFLRESPQWLASVGRLEEAHRVLKQMAKTNKRKAPPPPPTALLDDKLLADNLSDDGSSAADSADEGGTYMPAFCDARLRLRMVVMCLNWFGIAFAFYGLSLFSPNLPFTTYFANILSALVAIPFYLLAPVLLDAPWCGRKGAIVSSLLIGGVLLVGSTWCEAQWLSITVYYVANGSLSLAFAVLYIWAAELFPTDIRSRALSVQSVFARVGAVLTPYVVDLGSRSPALALCIFAAPCILAGLLDLLLPETCGAPLAATIADMFAAGDHVFR